MAQPLDPHIEGTLLRILQDVKQNPQDAKQNNDDVQSPRGRRFKEICDSLRDDDGLVFGKKGSELRRRVQRRRDHLLRYPGALQAALEAALKRELELPQPKSSPPTKITPAPAVSSIMPTGNNNNESFRLHFDESWGNPDGIFSLMAPNVKVGDRIVDKVRLLIPFHDVEDVPLFKARLSEDGSSFILTKPTIPGYLRDRENIEAITQYVDRSVGVACEQCKNLYEVQSTTMEMEENAHLRTKDTTYKFPDGITCNNDTFNLGQNGEKPTDAYSLRIRVNMDLTQLGEIASADENPKMAYGVHPFMAIEMAVDDIDAKVRRTKKVSEEEVNSVDEAFMNFGITRTPNRNRRGGGTGMTF
mmetsp:Transcript_8048/g.17383  ORF Transcript_8048/g.17383 Transcript_8048/m.17383 type:complete len:359 (-) Transcript_8048:516-1592(-)